MSRYVVTCIVEADRLGELITAATPMLAAPVQVAAEVVAPPPESGRRKRDARQDTPVSQTRLGKLVLGLLSTGQCTRDEVSEELRQKGFAATSVSPVTSKLVTEGFIESFSTSLNGRQTRCYRLTAKPPSAVVV